MPKLKEIIQPPGKKNWLSSRQCAKEEKHLTQRLHKNSFRVDEVLEVERGFPTCRDKGKKVMTRRVGGIRKCPTCEPIVNAKILQVRM